MPKQTDFKKCYGNVPKVGLSEKKKTQTIKKMKNNDQTDGKNCGYMAD